MESSTANQIEAYIHVWLDGVYPSFGGQIENDLIFSVIFMQYLHLFSLKNVKILFWLHYHQYNDIKSYNNLLMTGTYLD